MEDLSIVEKCFENIFHSSNKIVFVLFIYLCTFLYFLVVIKDSTNEIQVNPFKNLLKDNGINALFENAQERISNDFTKMTKDLDRINGIQKMQQLNDGGFQMNILKTKMDTSLGMLNVGQYLDHGMNTVQNIEQNFMIVLTSMYKLIYSTGRGLQGTKLILLSFISTLNDMIRKINKIPFVSIPEIPLPS